MEVSCLRENLERGLATIGGAIDHQATLPITQNVLLCADQGMLRLSATNLAIAITTWIGASVEGHGAIAVPARRLRDFIKTLDSDQINLHVMEVPGRRGWLDKHPSIRITSGRSQANFNGFDVREFPPIAAPSDFTASVSASNLRLAIKRALSAVSADEARPILTGVEMKLREGEFTMVGIGGDGGRLVVHRGKMEQSPPEDTTIVIPARSLKELQRLLGDSDEPVQILPTLWQNNVAFQLRGGDTVILTSDLLNGRFPNHEELVPQNFSTRAVMDYHELLRAIEKAAVIALDGSSIVRMQFKPNFLRTDRKLIISASSQELGEFEDELDVIDLEMNQEDESKIAFNIRYLIDILSVLDGGLVAIEITTPSSPGVFKPADNDDYVHVVMPMFVQW